MYRAVNSHATHEQLRFDLPQNKSLALISMVQTQIYNQRNDAYLGKLNLQNLRKHHTPDHIWANDHKELRCQLFAKASDHQAGWVLRTTEDLPQAIKDPFAPPACTIPIGRNLLLSPFNFNSRLLPTAPPSENPLYCRFGLNHPVSPLNALPNQKSSVPEFTRAQLLANQNLALQYFEDFDPVAKIASEKFYHHISISRLYYDRAFTDPHYFAFRIIFAKKPPLPLHTEDDDLEDKENDVLAPINIVQLLLPFF
jgi:hypothetical protein